MPAYLVADILEVTDPDTMAKYADATGPIVDQYGGRFVVAAPAEVLEGDWKPGRIVILEFDDMAALKRWYGSPEYQDVLPLRLDASRGNVIAVETG